MNRGIPCPPSSTSRPSNWPVTPEVAGSSPVAPVKYLHIAIFCTPRGINDRRPLWIPRRSRTRVRVLQRLFVLMRRRSSLPSRADPARPFAGAGRSHDRKRGGRSRPSHAVRCPVHGAARASRSGRPMARCEPAVAWREAGAGRRSRRRAARDRKLRRRRSRKLPRGSPESSSWVAM
jgi:hypothetical protein